jgi:hypothetical protein
MAKNIHLNYIRDKTIKFLKTFLYKSFCSTKNYLLLNKISSSISPILLQEMINQQPAALP